MQISKRINIQLYPYFKAEWQELLEEVAMGSKVVKEETKKPGKSMYSKYADKKKVAPERKPKLKESTYKAPKKKSWYDKFKPMSVKEYEATQPERKARRKAQQERRIEKRKTAVKDVKKKVKKSFKEAREYKSLSSEELRKRTKKPKKRNINKQR